MPRHSPRQAHKRAAFRRVLRLRWLVRSRDFQADLAPLRVQQIAVYGASRAPRPQRDPIEQRRLEGALRVASDDFEKTWKVPFALASWYLVQKASSPSGRVDEHAWVVDFDAGGGRRPERVRQQRPRRRFRPDSTVFQLAVWDEALASRPFKDIAQELRRKVSTVKSAFLVAGKKIYGASSPPSKRQAALSGLDKANHVETCQTCKAAQRAEDMCPRARLYAGVGTPRYRRGGPG